MGDETDKLESQVETLLSIDKSKDRKGDLLTQQVGQETAFGLITEECCRFIVLTRKYFRKFVKKHAVIMIFSRQTTEQVPAV